MRNIGMVRILMLLILGLCLFGMRMHGQNVVLSVAVPTNSILLGESITYTINVTNLSGFDLDEVRVTNTPSSLSVISVLTSQGTVSTNSRAVVFNLGSLFTASSAQMFLTLSPASIGLLTTTVPVA